MHQENVTVGIQRHLIPYASLPVSDEYDIDPYLPRLGDNLAGVLRQFQAAMLDLGNLMTADAKQRSAFRDVVFTKHREMSELMAAWVDFYKLHSPPVQEEIRAQHVGR